MSPSPSFSTVCSDSTSICKYPLNLKDLDKQASFIADQMMIARLDDVIKQLFIKSLDLYMQVMIVFVYLLGLVHLMVLCISFTVSSILYLGSCFPDICQFGEADKLR